MVQIDSFIPGWRTQRMLSFNGNLNQLDSVLFCNKDRSLHALDKNSNLFSELVQVPSRCRWDYVHNQSPAQRPSHTGIRKQSASINSEAGGGLILCEHNALGLFLYAFPLCNHGFNVYIFCGQGFVGSTALTSNHILCPVRWGLKLLCF